MGMTNQGQNGEKLEVSMTDRDQTRLPRPDRKPKPKRLRPRFTGSKLVMAGILATGLMAADLFDFVDLPFVGDISLNPGQQAGDTKLTKIDLKKFQVTGADAIGEADVVVSTITQKFIDKKEPGEKSNPHETMILRNGLYTAQWVVAGAWKPELTDKGDIKVTLPDVKGKNIVTKPDGDPVVDAEHSSRATMQKIGGIFGAETEDDVPRRAIRVRLTDWVKNPKESGEFQNDVACVALASASDKAKAISTSTKANVVSYTAPRKNTTPVVESAPTISFQIPDPVNKGKMLNIESCIPSLDNLGYDSEKMRSNLNSQTGLGIKHIPELKLPEAQQ